MAKTKFDELSNLREDHAAALREYVRKEFPCLLELCKEMGEWAILRFKTEWANEYKAVIDFHYNPTKEKLEIILTGHAVIDNETYDFENQKKRNIPYEIRGWYTIARTMYLCRNEIRSKILSMTEEINKVIDFCKDED